MYIGHPSAVGVSASSSTLSMVTTAVLNGASELVYRCAVMHLDECQRYAISCVSVLPCLLQVRVNESQVKNKLYVGNLPRSMTQHQVEEELKTQVVGESTAAGIVILYWHLKPCTCVVAGLGG